MTSVQRFCLLLLLLAGGVQAQPMVRLVGVFPGAAVLSVDGQRQLVRIGQRGPQGVEVLAVDASSARLRIDGVEQQVMLSGDYASGGPAPQPAQVTIARDGGHYRVAGAIEGYPVRFLVDTGASAIAMNEAQARRLGLDYRRGRELRVSTANGVAKAWAVNLRSVKVASLEVLGVEAAVLQGNSPDEVLLGMSFLNRVRWQQRNGALVLESSH